MKKFYFNLLLVVFTLSFTSCAKKEFSTNRYYEKYTKDEILYAGKLAFNEISNKDFVIDSYRDKLEVTNIEVFYSTLKHEDYIIEVKEDACGTDANLTIKNSSNMKTNFEYNSNKSSHNEIWERIDFFLGKKTKTEIGIHTLSRDYIFTNLPDNNLFVISKDKIIKPKKDLSNCKIENEFKNGVLRDTIEDENE